MLKGSWENTVHTVILNQEDNYHQAGRGFANGNVSHANN